MIGFLRAAPRLSGTLPTPESQVLNIDGRDVPLRFRRNAKARRLVLRLDGKTGGLVMTLPKRSSLAEALRFVEASKPWITRTLAKQAAPATIGNGAEFLYRGKQHVLYFAGGRRGLVGVAEGIIHVPGDAAHAPRRLLDFLKKQALAELTSASRKYAQAMETRFTKISIRDQRSRWGSCSANGTLSYSWRLILAPDFVLDYVAAHEVAHLREMNHGPRFWRLVLTHCPQARAAKQWLKTNGREVHRYL
ncbi:M48 family metallopeptidase [Aestuariivirga litoralis]|uniref:M48 family metallopeptidase n=1 Tax=Aestuariivirga litoralis TaxID=2650924 RepID=UPI0018C71BEA|nr:SprT family zinc-dependent metalloprotease [Aestuariivirga litoralis]MBG1233789.1 M48 family metallopeptidase [Aestuariivirga litoralis]